MHSFPCCFFVAALAGPIVAQSTENVVFAPRPGAAGGHDTVAIRWVDVDADGDADLFALHRNAPSVLYRNQGGELVADATQPNALLDPGSTRAVAFGDVDGDGDPDAYLARDAGEPSQLLVNLGGGQGGEPGSFAAVATVPALAEAVGVRDAAFGDLDGDGLLDLVVVGDASPALVAFGQGGFLFGEDDDAAPAQLPSPARAVALADLEGDGDLDIVVANDEGVDNDVWVNRGGGEAGVFDRLEGDPTTTGGGDSQDVTLADLDLDGLPELLVANLGAVNFLYQNVSAGDQLAFARVTKGPFDPDAGEVASSSASSVGDLENDGDMDIVIANDGMDNFVYLAVGESEFDYIVITDGHATSDGGDSVDASLADPDLDGDLELAIANSRGDDFLYENLGPLWVEQGQGTPGARGVPRLEGQGALLPGTTLQLVIRDGAGEAPATLFVGTEAAPLPYVGGVLVPDVKGQASSMVTGLTTDTEGVLSVTAVYPADLPTGFRWFVQAALVDATAVGGLALTNGLQATGL